MSHGRALFNKRTPLQGYVFILNVSGWEVRVSVWPSLQHSLFSHTWALLARVWPPKAFEFATLCWRNHFLLTG